MPFPENRTNTSHW